MSVPQTSSSDDRRVAAKDDRLDEYVQRTVAGDTIAFRSLYDLLSPYVRDSAACLFGRGDEVNNITDSVFVDVWHLAGRYQPGGEGVRAWVLNVAGSHTMSRYRPNAGGHDARHNESGDQTLGALLAPVPRSTVLDQR
jgi:DNA-directed RNA polymerase specialized sigma24 family protein